MAVTFATQFQKYKISDIMKDEDYHPFIGNANECKFWDKNKKFGVFHFFIDGLDVKYQILREVDDFIYIPVNELTYQGETIKQLISKVNQTL